MTDHTLKDGDLVMLNSGGPRMTVEINRNDGFVMCLWFDGCELRRDCFHPDMLRPLNDMPIREKRGA